MLIRPDFAAGTAQSEQRIRVALDTPPGRILSRIPVEQRVVPGRDRGASGSCLGTPPGLVRRVSGSIEATAVRSRLDEHQIAARVRGTIGDAVQDGVNIYARAQLRGEALLPGSLDDLGNGEVASVRVLSMKEGGSQPHLIGDLQFMPDFTWISAFCCVLHIDNVNWFHTKIKHLSSSRLNQGRDMVERGKRER
jgi:hypothetical protein